MDCITLDDERYAFLRNDYAVFIVINDKVYLSVESAYQSYRSKDKSLSSLFAGLSAKDARTLSPYMTETPEWDSIKFDVLYYLTLEKFKQHPTLRKRLVNTGDVKIDDEFLGDILMRVRNELSY